MHYRVLIRKLIGPCFTEYAAVIAKPIVLALCMGALMSLVIRFVALDSNILAFALAAIVGLVGYIVLSFVFQRALVTEAIVSFSVDREKSHCHKAPASFVAIKACSVGGIEALSTTVGII